jgi:glycosyltransferase involved in cell wall biosynthesis
MFLIGTLERGGAEGQLVELVTRIDRREFEPAVCCLGTGGPHTETLSRAGIPVEIIGYEGLRIFRYPLRTSGQLVRLVRLLRGFRPQILHAQLFWAYVIGALAGRVAGVPWIIASRLGLSRFRESLPASWIAAERAASRRTDLIVANSEAVREDVVRTEGIPREKITVVYNGVETARFVVEPPAGLREELALSDAGPVVAVVANLIHYKGHEVFLEAWAAVLDSHPRATALLIGDGPMRPVLEARAATRGYGESVRFLGRRQDVPQLLALADLLVHPSLEEGFCNAILEAMAASRPVVATNVGGNPEAVVYGTTGLLVPPGDAGGLATAMLRVLGDPAWACELGAAGRRRVEERFDMTRMVRAFESVYRRFPARSR